MFLELVIGFLSSQQGLPAYGWVFLLLALCGMGAPVSQDMLLLAAAGFTLLGALQPGLLVVVAALGLLAGDVFSFWVGHHWGAKWVPTVGRTVRSAGALARMEQAAQRHALPFSFVTRFLPGQRPRCSSWQNLRMPTGLIGDGVAALVHRFVHVRVRVGGIGRVCVGR